MLLLEALIGAIALIIGMARRGRRRKFRRYISGNIDMANATGSTLAASTGVRFVPVDAVSSEAWISSIRGVHTLNSWTPTASVGPMMCLVAHSDYTLAEIEEWIEAQTSWDEGDQIQRERQRRKIKIVGVFQPQGGVATSSLTINDGKPLTTKLGWLLLEGQNVSFTYYNLGSVALDGTTSPICGFNGKANLWPV